MARKMKPSPPASVCDSAHSSPPRVVSWKFTKSMNMRDLSRDDDYLSHLFIEKLGNLSAKTPIVVHKMDPLRRLPKTDPTYILSVVHRLVRAKPSGPVAVKQAVNELLSLRSVQYFIKEYDQGQINAFATHASRYLELYLPSGSIEIAQTSRYSKWTGKSELCIVSTRQMAPGFLIAELKGSMADLTEEEDRELKRTGPRNDGGTRRDFSVIHSKQLKKNHLFLGPARFVNHDCDNNAVLFRSGRYITFRAIKPIAPGQEITAHYGDGYFGKNNRHCLCETCERLGKGGYAPQTDDDVLPSPDSDDDSDIGLDSDSDTSSVISSQAGVQNPAVNLNERRTRRGVYLVIPESQADSDSSEDEADEKPNIVTLPPTGGDVVNLDSPSESMSRQSSLSSVSSTPQKTPFRSLISTRGQKAREASSSSISQLQTPPLSGSSSDSATHPTPRTLRNRKSEPIPQPPAALSDVAPRRRGRPRKALPNSTTASGSSPLKQADADSQSLRTRKSLPAIVSKKGDIPTAPVVPQKAKPTVPSCVTCSAPLHPPPPAERSPRKGKAKEEKKEECTRCKRHFLIFLAPWPQRIPNPGSNLLPTPRECTPAENSQWRVSHSNLTGIDKKLKGVSNVYKRAREEEATSTASKKRKIPPPGKQEASRVSGRSRVPSLKARESTGPIIKSEFAETVSLSGVLDSGRKGASQKRSREADPADAHLSQLSISEGLKSKRGRKSAPDVRAAEDAVVDDIGDADGRRDKSFWPCLPLPPNGLGAKHLGRLNVRPNPCRISRWRSSYGSSDSTPTLVDDDTDDNASDIHPSTPPDNSTNDDIVVDSASSTHPPETPEAPSDSDFEGDIVEKIPPPKLTVSTIGLFSKPNPAELARRIWAPSTQVFDSAEDEPRTPQRRTIGNTISSPESVQYLRTKLAPALSLHPKRWLNSHFAGQGDDGTSSGEDNVVHHSPGTSGIFATPTRLNFRLQALATFKGGSNDSSPSPSASPIPSQTTTSEALNKVRSPLTPFNPIVISPVLPREATPRSNRLRELSPSLHVLGPFHSDFAASPSTAAKTKPSLVNAGWESDTSSS